MRRLLPLLLILALAACDVNDPPPQPRLQSVEYGLWSPRSFVSAVQRGDAEIWSIVGIEPIIADDLRAYDLDFDCDGWIDTVIALHSRGRIDWVVARQHPPRSWRIVSQYEQTLDDSEMDEMWSAIRPNLATVNGTRFLTFKNDSLPQYARVFEITDGQLRSVPDATNHSALDWRHRRAPCAPPQDLPATHPAVIAYALREGAPRDKHRAVWSRIGVDPGDAQLGVQFSEIRAHAHYVNLNDDANPDAILTVYGSGSEAAWLIFEQTADAAWHCRGMIRCELPPAENFAQWLAAPAIERVSCRTFLIQRIDDPFGSAGLRTTIVHELRDGAITELLRDERSSPHRLRIEAIDDTDVRFSFEPTVSLD